MTFSPRVSDKKRAFLYEFSLASSIVAKRILPACKSGHCVRQCACLKSSRREKGNERRALYAKDRADIGVGDISHMPATDVIAFCQLVEHIADEGALVALSPHGYGSHVGTVGFEDNAL